MAKSRKRKGGSKSTGKGRREIVRPKKKGAASPPPGPYEELRSQGAVEKLMRPGGGTAVIDFWAPWCAPCRAMAPMFEAVAQEFAEEPVQFYKLNTEAQPDSARAFNIRSIPTLMFIHDGEIVDTNIGVLDGARLTKKVQKLLAKARGEEGGLLSRLFGS